MKDETIKSVVAITGMVIIILGGLIMGHDGVILGAGIATLGTYAGIKRDK